MNSDDDAGSPRPRPPPRLHITGASGSGTSSLAKALADRLGVAYLDTDDSLWLPSDPPYQTQRSPAERRAHLEAACASATGWVLAGSFFDWQGLRLPPLDLVVFLTAPTAVRIARLRARETALFGPDAVAPGGFHHSDFTEFLDWAAAYDSGTREGRSRPAHEASLATLTGPLLRIDGTPSLEDSLERCLTALTALAEALAKTAPG